MIFDDNNIRKLLIYLGQREDSITTKIACDWLYKRNQTSKNVCEKCLFTLKKEGLITFKSGRVKVTEKGRVQAQVLLEHEERSAVTLSDQQIKILQEISDEPKTVEGLRYRCFKELGSQHGSKKAVTRALKQLKERGLATTVGKAPLIQWVATPSGKVAVGRHGEE